MTHVEILGVDFAMLRLIEVFLCDQHAFTEEVLMDLLAVSLWDQPAVCVSAPSRIYMIGLDLHLDGVVRLARCWRDSRFVVVQCGKVVEFAEVRCASEIGDRRILAADGLGKS